MGVLVYRSDVGEENSRGLVRVREILLLKDIVSEQRAMLKIVEVLWVHLKFQESILFNFYK